MAVDLLMVKLIVDLVMKLVVDLLMIKLVADHW